MADNEISTKLTGEDASAPAFASVVKNANKAADAFDAIERKSKLAGTTATNALGAAGKAAGKLGEASTFAGGLVGGMFEEFVKGAVVVEVARRGFEKFAEQDRSLRRMQVAAGATRKEIDALMPTLRELGSATAQSTDAMIEGFDMLRERADLSLKDTMKIFPDLAKGAMVAGVSAKQMSMMYGSMMQNMKMQGKDASAAMDSITKASQLFQLNLGDIVERAPELTEVMGQWGYTGVDGLNKMLAFLGKIQPAVGSTADGARRLGMLFEQMGDEATANKAGMTGMQMQRTLRLARDEGQDVLGVYMSIIKTAQKRTGLSLEEIVSNGKLLPIVRQLDKNYDSMGHAIKEVAESTGAASKAAEVLGKGPAQSIERLSHEFGDLMVAIGHCVSAVNDLFGSENMSALEHFAKMIGLLTDLMNGDFSGFWKHMKEEIEEIGSGDAMGDLVGRMRGKGAEVDAQKKLRHVEYEAKKNNMSDEQVGAVFGEEMLKAYNERKADQQKKITQGKVPMTQSEFADQIARQKAYMAGHRDVPLPTPRPTIPEGGPAVDTGHGTSEGGLLPDFHLRTENNKALEKTTELLHKMNMLLDGGGDGSARVIKASLGGGGSGWGGGGSGGGGSRDPEAGGGGSGAGAGEAPMGGGTAESAGASATGGKYLQNQRKFISDEMGRDPGLRSQIRGMMQTEGNGKQSFEALANRTAYVNAARAKRGLPPLSVRQMLHGGFYGPINRGQLPGAEAAVNRNAKLKGQHDADIDAVLGGSNDLQGATDQGLVTDPNGRNAWGGFKLHRGKDGKMTNDPNYRGGGNVFLDWNGGPDGHRGATAFRQQQQEAIRREQEAGQGTGRPGEADAMAEAERLNGVKKELEKPVRIRYERDSGEGMQFRRASMRRTLDRELRDTHWNSLSDIGAA